MEPRKTLDASFFEEFLISITALVLNGEIRDLTKERMIKTLEEIKKLEEQHNTILKDDVFDFCVTSKTPSGNKMEKHILEN